MRPVRFDLPVRTMYMPEDVCPWAYPRYRVFQVAAANTLSAYPIEDARRRPVGDQDSRAHWNHVGPLLNHQPSIRIKRRLKESGWPRRAVKGHAVKGHIRVAQIVYFREYLLPHFLLAALSHKCLRGPIVVSRYTHDMIIPLCLYFEPCRSVYPLRQLAIAREIARMHEDVALRHIVVEGRVRTVRIRYANDFHNSLYPTVIIQERRGHVKGYYTAQSRNFLPALTGSLRVFSLHVSEAESGFVPFGASPGMLSP